MKLSKNFMTSFVSVDLHIRTTGHSLYRSIRVRMYGSPVRYLSSNSPEKSICIFCSGSANPGNLIFLRRWSLVFYNLTGTLASGACAAFAFYTFLHSRPPKKYCFPLASLLNPCVRTVTGE